MKVKKIRINQEEIDKILENIRADFLSRKNNKLSSYQDELDSIEKEPAKIILSQKAYIKMWALVDKFTTEVQWNATVYRQSENEYYVDDVFVSPQIVTGSTVNTDDEEEAKWLETLDDDTYNNIRLHGHSHVNMGVSPSGTDMGYREKVVATMADDKDDDTNFYIFVIFNKKREWSAEIYDVQNNTLYSTATKSIEIIVQMDDEYFKFLKDATEKVKEKTYAYDLPFSVKGDRKKPNCSSLDKLYNEYKDYDRGENPYPKGYYGNPYDYYD